MRKEGWIYRNIAEVEKVGNHVELNLNSEPWLPESFAWSVVSIISTLVHEPGFV